MKKILLIILVGLIILILPVLAQENTAHTTKTDNSFVWSVNQINYLDEDGIYKPIDLNLKSHSEGYLVMDNNYEAFFSKTNADVEIKRKGHEVLEYSIRNPLNINPIVNKNTIKYQDIFQNIDIEYIIEKDKLKENIIIKDKPNINKIYFDFDKKVLIKDGYLYRDGLFGNTKEWKYTAPFVEGRKDKIDSKISGLFSSTLEIDLSWIEDDENYPIIIDPSFQDTFVNDTFLESYSGLTVYNTTQYQRQEYVGAIAGSIGYVYEDWSSAPDGTYRNWTNASRYENSSLYQCTGGACNLMYTDNRTDVWASSLKFHWENAAGALDYWIIMMNSTDDVDTDFRSNDYTSVHIPARFEPWSPWYTDTLSLIITDDNDITTGTTIYTQTDGTTNWETDDFVLIFDKAGETVELWYKYRSGDLKKGAYNQHVTPVDISGLSQWYIGIRWEGTSQSTTSADWEIGQIYFDGFTNGTVKSKEVVAGNSSDYYLKTAQIDSGGSSFYDKDITWYLSKDNGTTWETATVGTDITFSAFESKSIKWKADINNTNYWNTSWVDSLNISWIEQPFAENITYNRLHNCTHIINEQSLGTNTVLNYTFRDEEDGSIIKVNLTHIYRLSDLGSTFEYNFNTSNSESLNVDNSKICNYPNGEGYNYTNEKLQLKIEAGTYDTRTFYIFGGTYNDTSANYTLYLLKTASSSEITVTVEDGFGGGLEDYIVEVWQQDLTTGVIKLVSTDITDSNGESIHNLLTSDSTIEHKFVVKDSSGTIRHDGNYQKLTSASYTIIIADILDSILGNSKDMQNIPHEWDWNDTFEFNLTFTYNDTNISSQVCLYLVRYGVYNDTTLTDQCSTDSNHTFIYHVGNVTGNYYAEGYGFSSDDGRRYLIDTFTFEIDVTALQIFGAIGLLILLFGYMFSLGAAFASERPALYFVLPVFWTALAGMLKLIPLPIPYIIGLAVIGGIVLWKSEI